MLTELSQNQKHLTIFGTCIVGLAISFLLRDNSLACTTFLGFVVFLITGSRPQSVYATVATLPRDVKGGYRFIRLNLLLKKYEWNNWTVPAVFQSLLPEYASKTAFIMENRKLTFQQVDDFSNQIASYFKSKGFKRGDTIALYMESREEYPCIWLGLSKIGIVTALINSNLRKEPLVHSIKTVSAKAIIVGNELVGALPNISNEEGVKEVPVFQFIDTQQRTEPETALFEGAIDLLDELQGHKVTDLQDEISKGTIKDKLVYIYTSGTTGMPKAAVITHLRYMFMGIGATVMLGISKDDIVYNPLPLYHTAGGMLGIGNTFLFGVTLVIRKKFSASKFWSDCIEHNCTVAQYIGELCRYLLSTPPKPEDTEHKVRLMYGNGLRPQIWQQFVSRFEISQIGECYGSTEGNSNLINCDNQVGAIGFVPISAGWLYPLTLIRCNEISGEAIRDENGRCAKCQPGEPGVFVGKIDPKRAHSSFHGYADKEASEKKILRDVFVKGDMYFNSGDILVRDILGYFYFKDRTGDTFRWRGENVATSEVEAIISNIVGLQDCVVYGVEIPHVEGKAGMAAIVDPNKTVDMNNLSAGIKASLPPYAQPLFIRIMDKLPITGTFKMKKRDLQIEGYDITKVKDPIYYVNRDGTYRVLAEKDYDDILNGRARL